MNKIVIGSLIAFLLVGVGAIWPRPWPPTTTIIPDTPQVGSATYITNNTQGPFDGVKASFINATNIEWWYFDALSVDGTQGVAAWMFTTNPLALGQNFTEVDFILFHARFADGTGMNAFLPSTGLVVETVGEGSSGFYEEIGSGWFGAPDLSSYTFFFNDLESNITGNVYVQSVGISVTSSLDEWLV